MSKVGVGTAKAPPKKVKKRAFINRRKESRAPSPTAPSNPLRLEILYRPIGDLVAYPKNARTHSPEQIEAICQSLIEFGWTNPVLLDGTKGIIAGHGRIQAAQKLWDAGREISRAQHGLVPCIDLTGLTAAQKRAYVIADNQLALRAGWDEALLSLELGDLRLDGFDLSVLGFEVGDLDSILGTSSGLTDPDDVPPAPVVPVSRAGDLWVLGAHRIMVGDCRDPAQVAQLLDGRALNLAFTSPPYAEQRDYDESSGFRPIPPREYVEWFAPVAANIAAAIEPDGSWFVNIKPPGAGLDTDLYVFDLVIAHVRSWGWHFATEFCWERNGVPKSVTQRFKNQFEPVYQFTRGRWKMNPEVVRHESDDVPIAGGPGVGNTSWASAQGGNSAMFGAAKKKPRRNGTSQSSFAATAQGTNAAPGEYIGPGLAYPGNRLPTFNSSHTALGHAAAFPVGLPEFFIKAYTDEGDSVFDPFLGSGSTLMACERTGRAGFGMELSQAYCDVSVLRWQQFTGKQATLESSGETFAEVRTERLELQRIAA
jgi:DNA modification methylase